MSLKTGIRKTISFYLKKSLIPLIWYINMDDDVTYSFSSYRVVFFPEKLNPNTVHLRTQAIKYSYFMQRLNKENPHNKLLAWYNGDRFCTYVPLRYRYSSCQYLSFTQTKNRVKMHLTLSLHSTVQRAHLVSDCCVVKFSRPGGFSSRCKKNR